VAPRALKLPAGKLVERSPVLVPAQHAGARPPTLPEPRATAQIQVACEGECQHGDHHRLPGHRAALQVQRLKAFRVRVAPGRPVEPDPPMPTGASSAGRYIRLYLCRLPPSRGVHRGPRTSVALQSTQFGAFTRRAPCTTSYTPAGHMWA